MIGYIVYNYSAIFVPIIDRLFGNNTYGGCAEIAWKSCNFSAVLAQSPQDFYGRRPHRNGDMGSSWAP